MDTIIVAVFAVCDDILQTLRQQDDKRAQMTNTKVIYISEMFVKNFHDSE